VLDAFHVTRLGFATVDDLRRRVQQDSLGHRGRRDDPLFRVRRLLRRRADRLTDSGRDRLLATLGAAQEGGPLAHRLGEGAVSAAGVADVVSSSVAVGAGIAWVVQGEQDLVVAQRFPVQLSGARAGEVTAREAQPFTRERPDTAAGRLNRVGWVHTALNSVGQSNEADDSDRVEVCRPRVAPRISVALRRDHND